MQKKEFFLSKTRGGLIVSCQALETEPLHSSYIMSRMAYAAKLGGACGIRANSVEDIRAIRATVDLPMIGIIKQEIASSPVYITPQRLPSATWWNAAWRSSPWMPPAVRDQTADLWTNFSPF